MSSPVGFRTNARRPDDLERFLGLQVDPGVDFADITFISVKFSRGSESYKTISTKFYGGPDPGPH